MRKLIILLIIAAIALFSGCSRQRVRRTMPVERRMELANHYYERGNYRKAIDHYTEVVFERSSIHTPLAQFRLGESYFRMGRYEDSIFEYRELIRLFPEFRDISIAYFRIGEALYHQSLPAHYCQKETRAAINAFNVFLDRFPFDEKTSEAINYIQEAQLKLLEKKYYNGYIYYKLYDYSASLLYLNEIIELENRSDIDRKSRYYAALIYIERKDRDNAELMLNSLREHYPDSSEANRVARMFRRSF